MYTYSIIISKIARKINRNVDFPGFFKLSIRLSVNPHWKLRLFFLSKCADDLFSLNHYLNDTTDRPK